MSCDPLMCRALKAHGVPAHDLRVLEAGAAAPTGSQVVVATAAIRKQFGRRLTSVYAPAVIASFGSGKARIDVRVVAPNGAAAYMSELRADQQQREKAGTALVTTGRFATSVTAQTQLDSGQVDSRLMLLLSLLATQSRLDIAAFGDSGPGATAGMPLRSVTLTGSATNLSSVLSSLRLSLGSLHPAHMKLIPRGTRSELLIEFAAPSPLQLLQSPNL